MGRLWEEKGAAGGRKGGGWGKKRGRLGEEAAVGGCGKKAQKKAQDGEQQRAFPSLYSQIKPLLLLLLLLLWRPLRPVKLIWSMIGGERVWCRVGSVSWGQRSRTRATRSWQRSTIHSTAIVQARPFPPYHLPPTLSRTHFVTKGPRSTPLRAHTNCEPRPEHDFSAFALAGALLPWHGQWHVPLSCTPQGG
jgi:hypothetical protein